MKTPTLLLLAFGLTLSGCTTIGQQVTNKNGTIAINQPSGIVPPEVKVENKTPAPQASAATRKAMAGDTKAMAVDPKAEQNPTTYEYEYQSRRVIGSYIVVQ